MFPKRSQSMSGPPSSGLTVIEGVLEKKKTFGSSRLHCALRDGKLWYFEDKGRENSIDISHAQSIREGKTKLSFEITTSSRTHFFNAESQVMRDNWISRLREAMRISSRKMSALSYLEPESDNVSLGSRSSLVTRPPATTMKPGVASTLPPSLITRTPGGKAFGNQGALGISKSPTTCVSETAFKPQNIMSDSSKIVLAAVAEKNEVSMKTIELRRGKETPIEINPPKDLISEIKVSSKDEDMTRSESCSSVVHSNNDLQVKELTVTSQGNVENVQCLNNSMLIEDKEESVGVAQLTQGGAGLSPAEVCHSIKSEGSFQSESLRGENSSGNQLVPNISKFTEVQDSEDVDENSDEVFPLISESRNIIEASPPPPSPPPRMVALRRSRSSSASDSFQVEAVAAPEPIEVELEVSFVQKPIPDLPHPHLESNRSSAFVGIRSFLSDKTMMDDSFVSRSSVRHGCAVESLRRFINGLD